MTDIPTTENYDFPVMSDLEEEDLEEETVDEWGDIIDNGADRSETDGLIEPLDDILAGLQGDVDGVESDLSSHKSDGNPHADSASESYADSVASDAESAANQYTDDEIDDHSGDSSAHHDPVDAGTMIDVSGQTVSHASTSSQSDVSAGDDEAITSINIDSRGHVTDIGTGEAGGADEDEIAEISLAYKFLGV